MGLRVFVAGASGVVGQGLLAQLVRVRHEVTGMMRSPARATEIRAHGAEAVVCDAFDRDRLLESVVGARPHVVVHQMTTIPPHIDPRRVAKRELGWEPIHSSARDGFRAELAT